MDTGTQANVLPLSTLESLSSKPHIAKTHTKLTAYNGMNIPVIGKCTLQIHHKDAIHSVPFIVTDTRSPSLLGLQTSVDLNLIKRIWMVNANEPEFMQEYKDVFEELGCLKGEHHINIDPSVTPQHDRALKDVQDRIRDSGLKLNKKKCRIVVTETTFLGHMITAEGIKPDPKKIEAITNMQTPSNKTVVQRFLGIITYLCKFLPHLSDETAQLRQLLEKDVEWHFEENHHHAAQRTCASPDGTPSPAMLLMNRKLKTHLADLGERTLSTMSLKQKQHYDKRKNSLSEFHNGSNARLHDGKAKDCADVYKSGGTISNVYTIEPRDGLGAFDVFCDQTTAGGGWTVLQKRLNGSLDFNRTWEEYKNGFGNFFTQEFWLGLDKIHRLTGNEKANRLRIELGVTNGEPLYAEYGWFGIGNESTAYRLKLSKRWDGTVKFDSLGFHKNFPFGIRDRDTAHGKCNATRGGGWWYSGKFPVMSNLNGFYPSRGTPFGNIHWDHLGSTPEASAPENTEMKIRPVNFE
ncbi:techylectin-5B-like [Stylophora pistillata]|uniref:techylectin-5B-like n=1 Tax=Stylophora pistillata TaxID=50429 RepID=UPI000C053A84|nr:techylectin-5B-like [Stylophora pistillata]